MAMKSNKLEYWRSFFSATDEDIFDIIEYAIVVAASDCPKQFKLRRDRIAERLFGCRWAGCVVCDRIEMAVSEEDGDDDAGLIEGRDGAGRCSCAAGSVAKESVINDSPDEKALEMNQFCNNYSDTEVEALTDEIEEKSQTIEEVLRIKVALNDHQNESDAALFDSLRRLQLMQLSVDTLKMTEIGKTVNSLRKHGSKQIRHLVRILINEWKNIVDEWVSASAAIAENSPDSVNHSVLDEEGLPSPPLDEAALLVTQPTTLELSQFFDGMDEDGNIQCINDTKDNDSSIKGLLRQSPQPIRNHLTQLEDDTQNGIKQKQLLGRNDHQLRKSTNSLNGNFGPGRPPKPATQNKHNGVGVKLEQTLGLERKQLMKQGRSDTKYKDNNSIVKSGQRVNVDGLEQKLPSDLSEKSKSSDERSVLLKLEATKRKLHEGYQQAENAKKQRTIQVMELHDLPKQSVSCRSFLPKHGNSNRHFSGGRR